MNASLLKSMGFILLGLTMVAAGAYGYGPSIHMREADQYIVLCEQNPMPYPEHNPELLRRNIYDLRLGAIWPDIARVVTNSAGTTEKVDEGLVDPHNRHFNSFILEDALDTYPEDEWKVAFALGNLIHNTGDLVAQGMLTQHIAVRGRLGELDVVVGVGDDHPGGENEGLLEGGLEFMQPELWRYTSMAGHFIFDPTGLAHLRDIYTYYMALWAEFFGPDAAADLDAEAGFLEVMEMVADLRTNLAPGHVHEGFYRLAASGFSDFAPLAAATIDWNELLRVLTGPVGTREFWDIYYDEGYFELSPTIMLTFAEGQGYYDIFPNWNAKMMTSGSIQALNYYLPGVLEEEDGRFIKDLVWKNDDTGQTITSIDAAGLPSSVTLTVTFYDVPGRSPTEDTVTLRVREDKTAGSMVASQSGDVGVDPWTYDVNGLAGLSVTFDPGPSVSSGAEGFFAEIAHGTSPGALPYFTTDWSAYEQITQVDLTKAAYTQNFSTYNNWPYSLKVTGTTSSQTGVTSFLRWIFRLFAKNRVV